MNTTRTLFASLLFAAAAVVCLGDAITDAELKQDVWEYLTTRFCGSRGGRRLAHARVLTDYIRFDGNTNRLAAVLVEVASSNNTWAAERAIKELEKYGTPAQLPFLYSCATNPAVANRAVNAVLRIEGVSSNSVEAASRMFSLADLPLPDYLQVTETCCQLMKKAMESGVGESCRSNAMSVVNGFATGERCNYYIFDRRRIEDDPTYGNSRRRLSYLRQIGQRSDLNEFQANYVTNAINELVAYPEANLPD